MKLLLALALLLCAAPLQAATFWVSPIRGTSMDSTTYSGADSTDANARSLAWFNASAKPGDVCRFKSGAYTDPIKPENNGTSANRIRYYGFPQDPGAVRVTNVQFGVVAAVVRGSQCTVRWVTTTSAFSGCVMWNGFFPTRDSIVACRSTVANSINFCGDSLLADSLTFSGTMASAQGDQAAWLDVAGDSEYGDERQAVGNVIKNSTFTLTHTGPGDMRVIRMLNAVGNTFFNNTFTLHKTGRLGYYFEAMLYESERNLFQNNTWATTLDSTLLASRGGWANRDSSCYNRFLGNALTISGAGNMSIIFSMGGKTAFAEGTHHNYMGFNTIKVPNVAYQSVVYYQEGLRSDTLEFNTFATSSTKPLISMAANADNMGGVIRHNAFFTAGPVAVDLTGGTGSRTSPTRLASNVYYCQSPNSAQYPNLRVVYPTELDSAGCFFSLGASTAANAIYYGGVVGAPGSGGVLGGTQSVWGSPRLNDSTYAALDARVTATGYAVIGSWQDGYAGIGTYSADVTAPAVSITYPADTSYTWSTYETMALTWTASDAVGVTSIAVQYGSTTDPAVEPTTYATITTLGGGVTSYNWVVSGLSERYGFVRVQGFDLAGNVGSDAQVFKFNLPADPDEGPDIEVP